MPALPAGKAEDVSALAANGTSFGRGRLHTVVTVRLGAPPHPAVALHVKKELEIGGKTTHKTTSLENKVRDLHPRLQM